MKAEKKFAAGEMYTLVFGLFLGLCIWKFGNPVILDQKILPPASPSDLLHDAWPTHWANWIFLPLTIIGGLLVFKNRNRGYSEKSGVGNRKSKMKWLWFLPSLWLGWQTISATQSSYTDLTTTTLWQFFGCAGCYFLGALLFRTPFRLHLLLIGVLTAFAFCLVRAADQKLIEFPRSEQMLVEGQRHNWTNLPPEMILQMKQENVIITTNGIDIANPVVLAKFAKGRVMGTMVYPNALAGLILLLLPLSIVLALTKRLRPAIRVITMALTIFLGGGGLFWSGSKLGWLIALAIGGLYLFRLKWPIKLKVIALIAVAAVGLGVFAIRFHTYFAKGATSLGARFDYWHAAVQTTKKNPAFGTGPGTFQKPYEEIKPPDAEMARLTHNDYLEQFSDSGIPGGLFYAFWIGLILVTAGCRVWKSENQMTFAVFAGLLGWFVQGVGEFSLYIPALAWTAFTLSGCLMALTGNQFDKKSAAG